MRAWQSVWRGAFVALFLITTVTACSVPVAPAQHSAQGVFERVGRFAINVEGPEGQRDAVQGSFSWKDDGQRLRLELFDPLGATQARVEVTDNLAWVQHADGREEYAAHADALMAQVVGSPIPVAGLRDWLEGHTGARPSSDLDVDEIDRPSSFTQEGWRVRLSRYDALGPTLLQLNRHDAQGQISVRLAIHPVSSES